MTHPDFKSGDDMIELHTVKRWFVVDEEGKTDYCFDTPAFAEQDISLEGPEEAQRACVPPDLLELGAKGANEC